MSWRKPEQHQESGDNKSKLKAPRFHPIFAAVAVSFLAIGYALATNPSYSLSAVWAFVIAAILGLYSFPLPKLVSIITMIAAIIAGVWLTANSFREVKDRRPYLYIKAIHSYIDKPSLKDNGTIVTLVIENAGDEPAFNATCDGTLAVSPEELHDIIPPSAFPAKLTPAFIPAKGTFLLPMPGADEPPFDETLIPLIDGRESFLYIWGTIRYDGKAGLGKKTYTCDFSFAYDANLKSFYQTTFHNQCEEMVNERSD